MTSTQLSPSIITNIEFLENYIDCVENLPLDVQRFVSQLKEYDLLYRTKLEQIGEFLNLYRSETSSVDKRKLLTKIQKCLIKSQHYGDEKLHIISQIVELVETRAQQVAKDAHMVDMDYKEEISKSINNNHRMKLDKPPKTANNEKTPKNMYEKPKRVRRVRALDKLQEKDEKLNKDPTEENEDEEMEEEDEVEATKHKKEAKKTKEKEKVVKEKVKEEKEEKKEEKKVEKNHKTTGKVTKKTTSKQITKIKKKKKKEKELSVEDIPVDPDEPVYCVCNSISYGDMIGCDNEECQIEWFHFGCVNLTNKPKGKWFCPPCTLQRKERNKK